MGTQKRCMGYMAVVVDDYGRAIEDYTDKLGFTLVEDTQLSDGIAGVGSANRVFIHLS